MDFQHWNQNWSQHKSLFKKLKAGKKITYQAGYGKDIVKKTAKVLR